MKTADKQKMCHNCHGRISVEAETCLYCGQEQMDVPVQEQAAQTTLFEQQSLQDSLTSLYSPPYSAKRSSTFTETPERPQEKSLKQAAFKEVKESDLAFSDEEDGAQEEVAAPKGSLWSLLLLLLGGNLFILGLMQIFFSEGNRLRLEWQTDSWYLYCLAAVPLLFVGYRLASKLK